MAGVWPSPCRCVEKLLLSPESLQLTFAVTYCPAVSTFVLLRSPGFVELHICAGRSFHAPTLLPCGTADSELSPPQWWRRAAPGEDCRGESDSGARVSEAGGNGHHQWAMVPKCRWASVLLLCGVGVLGVGRAQCPEAISPHLVPTPSSFNMGGRHRPFPTLWSLCAFLPHPLHNCPTSLHRHHLRFSGCPRTPQEPLFTPVPPFRAPLLRLQLSPSSPKMPQTPTLRPGARAVPSWPANPHPSCRVKAVLVRAPGSARGLRQGKGCADVAQVHNNTPCPRFHPCHPPQSSGAHPEPCTFQAPDRKGGACPAGGRGCGTRGPSDGTSGAD